MPFTADLLEADAARLGEAFVKLHGEGYRLVSISMFGPRGAPMYAALWHQTWGPPQKLVLDVSLTQYLSPSYHASAGGPGYHPALVGGMEGEPARFVVVYEAFTPTGDEVLPAYALHMSAKDLRKFVRDSDERLWLRSVAGLGRRGRSGIPGASDTKPIYCATYWPQRAGRVWDSRGIRVEPLHPDWRYQFPAIVMRSHSDVVIAGAAMLTHPEDPATPAPGHGVELLQDVAGDEAFSVWSDRRYDPWPTDDPFAIDPSAIGDLMRVDICARHAIVDVLDEREAQGHLCISLTAHGEGGAEDTRWHVVWAPPHAWTPLPRHFIRNGPGDGTNPIDPGIETVGARRILPRSITRAGRHPFQRLHEIYEERRISENVVKVVPRAPWTDAHRRGVDGQTPGGLGTDPHDTSPQEDGGIEADAGSTDVGPWDVPTPDAKAPKVLHPFDTIMSRMMLRGARAGYLVVLRRGRVAFARAYTNAEEGYPIASLDDRYRIASSTKAILATLVIRQARSYPNGLATNFADLLGVSPRSVSLATATVDEALRHATGLKSTRDGLSDAYALALANGNDNGKYMETLGTAHRFYEDVDDPDVVPGHVGWKRKFRYNNWVYACLAEMYGRQSNRASTWRWGLAIADALAQVGIVLDAAPDEDDPERGAMGGNTYRQCRAGGEVPYHSRPSAIRSRWPVEEEAWPYVPRPYLRDSRAQSGAIEIVMTGADMARFLGGLTPRLGRFSWLTETEFERIARYDPDVIDSIRPDGYGKGLAWSCKEKSWTPHGGAVGAYRFYWHTGAWRGTSAQIAHMRPQFGALADLTDTLSFGFCLNVDVPNNDVLGMLFEAAQQIEDSNGWPPGDLLGVL